jgi:hypothetical protein
MAQIHAPGAHDDSDLRSWRADTGTLSWRRLATVAAVALLLSTQIFFQAGIGELIASGSFIAGWMEIFAEALACGVCMWLCVAAVEKWRGLHGAMAFVAVCAALFAGSLAGVVMTLWAVQPAGFDPPAATIAGDALRWALWGAIVYAAHAEIVRRARATTQLELERIERARAERKRAEADLQLLRAQIQPHFLFNMLAHVRRLYRIRPIDGGEAVQRLRAYLRDVLASVRADESTLKRELGLVRSYLALVQVSMESRLSYDAQIDAASSDVPIPPLAVLTLVENAIKHGVAPRREGGRVSVSASRVADAVRIEVRDDGVGLHASSGNGYGLANAKSRLKATHGERARLTLRANEPRGAVATIEIESP